MSDPTPTAFETIRLTTQDAVATITLNRPQRLNAAPPQMFQEIHAALQQLPALGARALTGSPARCARTSAANASTLG